MQTVKLTQGSGAWHKFRAEKFTASDAPAMLGLSKYKSRSQLLAEKCEGVFEEITPQKQALFDKGHAAENAARPLVEKMIGEELFPATAISDDWDKMAASFDGVTMLEDEIFEHKLYNRALVKFIEDNNDLPDTHWPQVEHQLYVSKAGICHFRVSDGTEEVCFDFKYTSKPERMAQVVDGWKVFESDMSNYKKPEEKQDLVAQCASLPVITFNVTGTEIKTNISSCLEVIKQLAESEKNKLLETDQDFADKDQLNKDVKKARAKLKDVIAKVRGEFVSYAEFEEVAQEMDSVLQGMQSFGEKQVKQAKENKKESIRKNALDEASKHLREQDNSIKPFSVAGVVAGFSWPDFLGSMKNKRTIESIENAVSETLANWKIEVNQVVERVKPNVEFLAKEAANYKFLFNDATQILNQEPESFKAVVKLRISDYEKAEAERREKEREEIKRQEEAKAEAKLKAQEEAKQIQTESVVDNVIENDISVVPSPEAHKTEPVNNALAECSPKQTVNCANKQLPPDCLGKVIKWASLNNVSMKAVKDLENILAEYF